MVFQAALKPKGKYFAKSGSKFIENKSMTNYQRLETLKKTR